MTSPSPLPGNHRAETLQPIADSRLQADMAIICLVGEELRGRADSVARIFTALAAADINPRVITRSASEINLAFLVPGQAIEKAVRCLHPLLLEGRAQ